MAGTPPPVVVAVGRRGSAAAVDYAAAEALRQHRGLHVVHAIDDASEGAHTDAELAALHEDGGAVLEVAVARAEAEVSGLAGDLDPRPFGTVAAVVAAGIDAPLVVVGRCPESARVHPYVRSVTGGVAARAHVPVVSVPDGWTDTVQEPHVVVGVDDPESSAEVLHEAFAAARTRGARLTVVTTWWLPTGSGHRPLTQVDDPGWPESLRTAIDRATAELRSTYDDVPLEIHVRNARPGEALIEASEDAVLLVVGRHDPLLPTGSHLGPVARAVLRDSASPVLLATPRHAHHVHPRERSQEQPA